MGSSGTQYGRRLLVNVIDERADASHDRPFASLPKSNDPKDGFRDIKYELLRRGIDYTAKFLEEQIGTSTAFKTFGWIAPPNDFRYILLALAAMKTRLKAFFPSPRNHVEAQVSLIDACGCDTFLVPGDETVPGLNEILQQRPMCVVKIPSLKKLLWDREHDAKPHRCDYDGTFESARFDPCMVLHTSGSTGSKLELSFALCSPPHQDKC